MTRKFSSKRRSYYRRKNYNRSIRRKVKRVRSTFGKVANKLRAYGRKIRMYRFSPFVTNRGAYKFIDDLNRNVKRYNNLMFKRNYDEWDYYKRNNLFGFSQSRAGMIKGRDFLTRGYRSYFDPIDGFVNLELL